MTDIDDAARLARVAELQRRRASKPRDAQAPQASSSQIKKQNALTDTPVAQVESMKAPVRSRRADIGHASKIGAAGIGFMVMFGLIAAMGYVNRNPNSNSQPVATSSTPVVVVLHSADGSIISTDPTQVAPVTGASNQPVVLEAQPTVRQAPASQSPAGQTNGSR